ncbi:MAG: cytochrome c oxidase assembly protein [Acidimicrobiales bacterium]
MPVAWSLHPLAWVVTLAAVAGYAWALRRLGPTHAPGTVSAPADRAAPPAPLPLADQPSDQYRHGPGSQMATRGQLWAFAGGVIALWVALSWPLADLSRNTSAIAHVTQQVLLVLAVPPLVLLGLPRWLLALGTRSPRAESAIRAISHPAAAIIVFNAALVAAWLPPVVAAEARWMAVGDAVHLLELVAGFVMWIPATRLVPGTRPLSAAARIGYLFAQSVVFNFPALILIFAPHPLYAVYAAHVHSALGIGPRADQQIAGAVAKVIGFGVLIGTVAVILNRGWRAEEAGLDPDPLVWDDVERELRRLERRSNGTTDAG